MMVCSNAVIFVCSGSHNKNSGDVVKLQDSSNRRLCI